MKNLKLIDFFKMFDDCSSHHLAAIEMLEDVLPKHALDEEADWVVCFMASVDDKYNSRNT